MNKIKYCIMILFLLGSTIKPNPIAITYFSELYFTSTGWKLELHKNYSWEADTLLGLYLTNSAGQKAFIKDTLILYENDYIILTEENLDSPFQINKQNDTITFYRPNPKDINDHFLDEIGVDFTDIIYPVQDFSICFIYSHYIYPYYDYSPTLGFENDTVDAYCTVSGIIRDSVGNAVRGARVVYDSQGAKGEGIQFVVTDAEGRFAYTAYSGRRWVLVDTLSLNYQYSWPNLKYIEFHALPRQYIFLDIELPIISTKKEMNYFPLEIGNRWDFELYSWDNGLYYDYDTVKVEVLYDTTMHNGKTYFFVENMFWGISSFVRTDSNGIYYYLPYDSLEYFTYRYYVVPNQPYRIHPSNLEYPNVTLSFVDTASIFGQHIDTRTYGYNSGLGGFSISFSDKFGPYKGRAPADGTTLVTDSKLLGCRISGTEYGKLTSVEFGNNIPYQYDLYQNYPNPFNPVTTIRYSVPEAQNVQLKIFDIIGREVATLVNEQKPAGEYKIEFNAANLSSGIYLYKITAGKFTQSRKMIVLK